MKFPKAKIVSWAHAHRIISTIHPPIDLFEDIADPKDWDLIIAGEAMSNPRLLEGVGKLALVPEERRVGGPGSSYVMAPFTHISTHWDGRFHDGTYGAYYVANRIETALAETCFHRGEIYCATNEDVGWFSQYRELIGTIDATLNDVTDIGKYSDILDRESYSASQAFAGALRARGSDGVVYQSVRDPKGLCVAAFWPDVVGIPIQGRTFAYHFDGERIDFIRDEATKEVFQLV